MRDLLLLTVLIALFFSFMLGNRALSVPDEGRYVEISREMAVTGDYLTPRLNGVKYFEKPPLFYWLEAFMVNRLGLGEFTLRLWPALFALAGCLCVYGAGRRLFGRRTGIVAAIILATSLLYYGLSRVIILDMPVTVLLTASLLSFLVGMHEAPGLRRRLVLWAFYAFAALAVLTKGLIGVIIPGMAILAWIALLGEWRMLRSMHLPSGLAVFLLIAAPWHVLASRANPEFFDFYFVREHFLRYLTTVHHHYRPAWYFIPVVLGGLFPWSAFLVQAVRHSLPATWRERHEHRESLFLLLWAGLVFLFFSASSSKLAPYILPVFPPLALLTGRYLADAWESRDFPGVRAGYRGLLIVALLLCALLLIAPFLAPREAVQALGRYRYALALTLAVGAAAAWLQAERRGPRRAFLTLAAASALFLLLVNAAAPALDVRSIKPLARALKPLLRGTDEVASYATYYQDLPVYLEKRITIVDWKGELEFGTTVEDVNQWMTDAETFRKRWQGPGRIFLVTAKATYENLQKSGQLKMFPVSGDHRNIVACNQEVLL